MKILYQLSKAFILLIIQFLILSNIVIGDVIEISGSITSNQTWTSDNTYKIVDNVTIVEGIKLTINPGTLVKFDSYRVMYVNGTLSAQGTSDHHIVFTSAVSTPSAGDWIGIYFGSTSEGGLLDYCEVKYAGDGRSYLGKNWYTGILVYGTSPTITNCVFAHNRQRAISCYAEASPSISGNTVSFCGDYFIGTDLSSIPHLTLGTNTVTGGTSNAIEVWGGSILVDATWANHSVPYVMVDDITVGEGITLNIAHGTVLKFNDYRGLFVNGTLSAQGTSDQHIVFTSAVSTPSAGNWIGIYFGSTSEGGLLDYCEVKYAGDGRSYLGKNWYTGILVYGTSPTITNCVFAHNRQRAISCYAEASPSISGNTVSFCGDYFIGTDLSSIPHLTLGTNTVTGGTSNAIEVWGGSILVDARWANHGVPYIIYDNITVIEETILNLETGTVLKFSESRALYINGSLRARGNTNKHILFTSLESPPSEGDWIGIYFGSTSKNDTLEYCEVKYAGHSIYYLGSYRYAGIFCYNSSPIISNSFIKYNNRHGIYTTQLANPVITPNNTIMNNTEYGVYNDDLNVTINATYNYWGNPSGPYHPQTNPGGTGNAVSDSVNYSNWLEKYTYVVQELPDAELPDHYELFQNYPNPFNSSTNISYQIPTKSYVNISIFDINGRLLRTLVNQRQDAAKYKVIWDGKDNSGNNVCSGVYFYVVKTGNFIDSRKMLILR